MANLTSLHQIFNELQDEEIYKDCTKRRIIKLTLLNSIIRVFVKTSKAALTTCLFNLPVEEITAISDQKAYDKWHMKQVKTVYKCLYSMKENIDRLGEEGLLYGHANKVFNIYIGLLVFYGPYFSSTEVKAVKKLLHVPLDSKVFKVLKACSVPHIPASIKNVNKSDYYRLQKIIRMAAIEHHLPPFYFDEYAWGKDNKD